ncbi:MAG: hypothetical protein H0V88_10450 [Pyrinomonadaceae bacterium]|nr:hypothetical protein [Pyrinomonadaceae bacterium]
MRFPAISGRSFITLLFAFALGSAACQQPADNANTTANANANNANAITTAPVNANESATVNVAPGLDVREPDKYKATFTLSAQTSGGERVQALPQLTAEVARNGADHYVKFRTPSNEEIIYLDRADKRFIVLPKRNQYAELTRDSTGFDIPRTMTPAQMVQYLQNQRGYERVGEEQMNGRTVIKYRFAGATNTNTQAGQVKNETFVFVDKDTGLPLRSELNVEATGQVQGTSALRAVAEMRELQTDFDTSIFNEPTNMNKVAPEQVRQQVDAVMQVATAIIGNLLNNMNQGQGGNTTGAQNSNSPSTNMSPAASPTPQQQQ